MKIPEPWIGSSYNCSFGRNTSPSSLMRMEERRWYEYEANKLELVEMFCMIMDDDTNGIGMDTDTRHRSTLLRITNTCVTLKLKSHKETLWCACHIRRGVLRFDRERVKRLSLHFLLVGYNTPAMTGHGTTMHVNVWIIKVLTRENKTVDTSAEILKKLLSKSNYHDIVGAATSINKKYLRSALNCCPIIIIYHTELTPIPIILRSKV